MHEKDMHREVQEIEAKLVNIEQKGSRYLGLNLKIGYKQLNMRPEAKHDIKRPNAAEHMPEANYIMKKFILSYSWKINLEL